MRRATMAMVPTLLLAGTPATAEEIIGNLDASDVSATAFGSGTSTNLQGRGLPDAGRGFRAR